MTCVEEFATLSDAFEICLLFNGDEKTLCSKI